MNLKRALLNDARLALEAAKKAKELLIRNKHLYSSDELIKELKSLNYLIDKIEKNILFFETFEEID